MKRFCIVVVLLLQGCVPKTHELSLYNLDTPFLKEARVKQNVVLRVDYPTANDALSGSRIYYKRGATVGYYLYSNWSSSLNRLLYSQLLQKLQESKIYKNVVGYSSTAKADRVLELKIVSFYHIVKEGRSYTDIILDAKLIDANGKILKSKEFHYKRALPKVDAVSFVWGSKRDLREFFGDLTRFLSQK